MEGIVGSSCYLSTLSSLVWANTSLTSASAPLLDSSSSSWNLEEEEDKEEENKEKEDKEEEEKEEEVKEGEPGNRLQQQFHGVQHIAPDHRDLKS